MSKEVKDWDITNLINKKNSLSNKKTESNRRRHTEPQEEEKVPPTYARISNDFDINFPSDIPSGEDQIDQLRRMEQELFPQDVSHSISKSDKKQRKAYKKIRNAAANTNSNVGHNFVGNGIRVNQEDNSIERYLNEIRGQQDEYDPLLPQQHPNRVRGLDEQDNINHPLLSEALAYNDDGTPVEIIAPEPPEPLVPPEQVYVMPNIDPKMQLQHEILRNKQAKARLRQLEKEAAIQKAREKKPLQKYYNQNSILQPKPRSNSNNNRLVYKARLNRTNRTEA